MRKRILTAVLAAVLAILAVGCSSRRPTTQTTRLVVPAALKQQMASARRHAATAERHVRTLQRKLRHQRRVLHSQKRHVSKLRRQLAPVAIAEHYLGVPYVWGGESPSGFDCSGLVRYVFGKLGISLPHHAASQMVMGHAVSTSAVEPGDLVFYEGGGHVAIYVGHGEVIHAPHTGDVVKLSPARMMAVSAVRRVF